MAFGSGINQALKEAVTWGTVICICSAGFAYQKEISAGMSQVLQIAEDQYKLNFETATSTENQTGFERRFEIRSNRLGQFEVQGTINGHHATFLADTGATLIALTHETAENMGLNPSSLNFNVRTKTANGVGKAAYVMLDRVEIGNISVKNVQATVLEPEKLHVNLLGMSFMNKLNRVEMRDGKLVFVQ